MSIAARLIIMPAVRRFGYISLLAAIIVNPSGRYKNSI